LASKPTRAPPDDQFQVAGRSAYASKLGLASSDPSRTSADDAAHLMNYVRTQQPEVLKKAVQEKPWFVKAMANPVIMGAGFLVAGALDLNHEPDEASTG
jgi:hypothetical protein